MRGAALKLGQMLSIQDESLVPAPILSALDIVRQGADVMPRTQLNNVLVAELGSDWTHNLISFDYEPLASASIGQVINTTTITFFHHFQNIESIAYFVNERVQVFNTSAFTGSSCCYKR